MEIVGAQKKLILGLLLFTSCLLITGCPDPPNPIQGCNTYGITGGCCEGGMTFMLPNIYTVCADNPNEAISVGSAVIAYRNKCSACAVSQTLYREDFCELKEDPNDQCKALGNKQSALMAYKSAYSTFDGVIDKYKSWISFTNLDDNDSTVVNIEGNVSITGGNCLGGNCPFEITWASVKASSDFLLSGKSVKEVEALNHGIWSGYKYPDDTFKINSPSYLSISGKIDGKYNSIKGQCETHVSGKFAIVNRKKGLKSEPTNSLIIDGSFVENNILTKLHIHTWLADCKPEITATVSCVTGIDYEPRGIKLEAINGKMLANVGQKDLCNAFKLGSGSTTSKCGISSDPEFESYDCFKGPENTSGKLEYQWKDGNGNSIGDTSEVELPKCPIFPIGLTVKNEWGHVVKEQIFNAPDLGKCSNLCKPAPPTLRLNLTKCLDPVYAGMHLSDCSHFKDFIKDHSARDFDIYRRE